jgi:hypothetical protein
MRNATPKLMDCHVQCAASASQNEQDSIPDSVIEQHEGSRLAYNGGWQRPRLQLYAYTSRPDE